MIIALYALAFAMIAGGLFAAVLGWDIVLVERGWTMVISGIVGASSGALLIGLASVVSRLGHIQQELARIHLSLEDEAVSDLGRTPAEQARGRMLGDLTGDFTGGLAAGALAGGLFGSKKTADAPASAGDSDQLDLPIVGGPEPVADATPSGSEDWQREAAPVEAFSEEKDAFARDRARPTEPMPPYDAVHDEVSEGKVPDFLFAERYRETTYTEVRFPERDAPLAATEPGAVDEPDDHREDVFEEPNVETLVEIDIETVTVSKDEAEPESLSDDEAEVAAEGPPTVVGTYNSGDNKYVMFSDGSIEAETPDGFFRFASLEELKEFIAAGGEGSTAEPT
jgi:hypothetical protein